MWGAPLEKRFAISVRGNCLYVMWYYLVHNCQESACLSELRALKECCEKLKPEIRQYSVHCGGVVKK